MQRILKLYKRSLKVQRKLDEWARVPSHQKIVNDLVKNGQISNALSIFGKHPITVGLNACIYHSTPSSYIDEQERLFKSLTNLDTNSICFPKKFSLAGKRKGDSVIPVNAYRLGYYLKKILDMGLKENKTILEIGGGWGGLAHIVTKNTTNRYIIVDIPNVLIISAYFLIECGKKVCLFGEYDSPKDWEKYDCILMPPSAIEEIPNDYCDLVINTASLKEMGTETINYYLNQIKRLTKFFYHDNKTTPVKAAEITALLPKNVKKILSNFDLLYSSYTPINGIVKGNSSFMENLYKKTHYSQA